MNSFFSVVFVLQLASLANAQNAACDGEAQTCGNCVNSVELGGGCSWCDTSSACYGPFDASAPCSGSWKRTCSTSQLNCWQYSTQYPESKIAVSCPTSAVCGMRWYTCSSNTCGAFQNGMTFINYGCFAQADCNDGQSACCSSNLCNVPGFVTGGGSYNIGTPGATTASAASPATTPGAPTAAPTGVTGTTVAPAATCPPGTARVDSGQCVEPRFACAECIGGAACDMSLCAPATINGVRYCAKSYVAEKDGLCKSIADSSQCCKDFTATTTAVATSGVVALGVSTMAVVVNSLSFQ